VVGFAHRYATAAKSTVAGHAKLMFIFNTKSDGLCVERIF